MALSNYVLPFMDEIAAAITTTNWDMAIKKPQYRSIAAKGSTDGH